MPDILVRDLDARAIKRLKARARRSGRSLQSEARLLLERAGGSGGADIAAMFGRWHKRLAGRRFTNSVDLIREDRQR
jgi:hypothetical protein